MKNAPTRSFRGARLALERTRRSVRPAWEPPTGDGTFQRYEGDEETNEETRRHWIYANSNRVPVHPGRVASERRSALAAHASGGGRKETQHEVRRGACPLERVQVLQL
ncbi:hypothetical protein EYF80_044898 [Liparis tanakae]|uniref:Uncharacterized protein n=1 Tax=Liparis tanakae TaxID=230148 RepID=A0A4Z2FVP9_9TELE|nr:hypothetical protein EYF80_044898 [Liparis tanakae]